MIDADGNKVYDLSALGDDYERWPWEARAQFARTKAGKAYIREQREEWLEHMEVMIVGVEGTRSDAQWGAGAQPGNFRRALEVRGDYSGVDEIMYSKTMFRAYASEEFRHQAVAVGFEHHSLEAFTTVWVDQGTWPYPGRMAPGAKISTAEYSEMADRTARKRLLERV